MATVPQLEKINFSDPTPFRKEIDEIASAPLPAEIQWWVNRYNEQIGMREGFLWKWCWRAVEITALPNVNSELSHWNNQTKLLGVMLDVVVDDIGDQNHDSLYLEKLIRALTPLNEEPDSFDSLEPEQRKITEFALSLWGEINQRVNGYPRYDEFKNLLGYDYMQIYNVVRYSALINTMPTAMNMIEHNLYAPHNMHMVVNGTMDLMCSTGFDAGELGNVRSALWLGSSMGRVGNLTTTWEREVYERDFSSGVFALALDESYFTPEELNTLDPKEVEKRIRQYRCEEYFLMQWYQYRERIIALAKKTKSIDLMGYVSGLDHLLLLHLGSRGLK